VIYDKPLADQNGGSRVFPRLTLRDLGFRLAGTLTARRKACTCLAGGSCDVGGDDIGGVPVQGCPGPVVSHGCPWVGVGSGFLHVPQGHAGVQGGGDERMPQRMRPDVLVDPGPAGDAADDPGGAVPVQPPPVRREEDRSLASLADGQVDRPRGARRQGDGDDLAALVGDDQGAVTAFQA
jgi:hypothetical protein